MPSHGDVIQGFFPRGVRPQAPGVPSAVQRQIPEWARAQIARGGNVPAAAAAPPYRPPVQRHPAPRAAPAQRDATQLPATFAYSGSGGTPLPRDVRQRMETFFGATFADVRVHVDRQPAAIGALAFTRGSNIHFSPGHYDPATQRGREILAHELAHVVQQRAGRVRNPFGSGIAVVQDAGLEAEAHRMGLRASTMIIQRASALTSTGSNNNNNNNDDEDWSQSWKQYDKKNVKGKTKADPRETILELWTQLAAKAQPYRKLAAKMKKGQIEFSLSAGVFEAVKSSAAALAGVLNNHVAYPGSILEPLDPKDQVKYGTVVTVTLEAGVPFLEALLSAMDDDSDALALVASGLIDAFITDAKTKQCITATAASLAQALKSGAIKKKD